MSQSKELHCATAMLYNCSCKVIKPFEYKYCTHTEKSSNQNSVIRSILISTKIASEWVIVVKWQLRNFSAISW